MGEQRNKIFVGGVSWATDEKKFNEHFGPYGEITDCVIMRNLTTGNSRGFGFVTFADSSSVDKVFEVGDHMIDGKKLDLKVAVARGEMTRTGQPDQKARRTCKVFLGGIHLETTKTDLEDYFGKYGPVAEAVVMMDRETGRSRGFGFVTFQSEDTVDRLLQEEHEIRGRKIDCKKAIPREETAEVPNFRNRMQMPMNAFQPVNLGNFDRDVRGYYEQRAAEDARRAMGRAPDQFRDRDQNDRFGGPKSAPVFPNQTPSYASPSPAYAAQAPAYANQTNVYATQAPRAAPYSPTPNVYASNGFGSTGSYTNGPAANAWDYSATTPAAYGGGNYASEPMYAQATSFPQAGYGATRSTATATSRYRPY
jgi:RNA recognition motif-containing protein